MNILIAGGAGFIGSHLCDYLVDSNKVVVLDNLSLGTEKNISHLYKNKNFTFIKGDILDNKLLDEIFRRYHFDLIYHLAANSDIAISHKNPNIDRDSTFLTTYSLLSMMKIHCVNQIIFASSSAIYGDTGKALHEDYGPLIPVSHYGAAKLASEAFIYSFCENYNFKCWIARFPNVVGERATHGVIFDFINKLKKQKDELKVLGNGEQCKPYLYVKDLIEAILHIYKNANDNINIYNIGVESSTKVKEIAANVIAAMRLDAQIVYAGGSKGWIGDVPQFNYNLAKINSLGWKARYTSTEAVKKSIENILAMDNR